MGKLLDNEIFRKCNYLSVFSLVLFLSFSFIFAEDIEKKLNDFDKLTDKDKTKAIYQECVESNIKLNNPKVNVHGTEYVSGQSGRIFVEFLDTNGTPINNGSCFATVYKPDTSLLYNSVAMPSLGSNGLYYYDFMIPPNDGVYMVSVICMLPKLNSNSTYSLYQTSNFDNPEPYCEGTGYTNIWDTGGIRIYDAIQNEPESGHITNNFISIAGGFTRNYQKRTSYLIKAPPNGNFNQIDFVINSVTGTPYNSNWNYNISICPTNVYGLTSNATSNADCNGTTTLLSQSNTSCLLNNPYSGQRRLVPLKYIYTINSSNKYILSFEYNSGGIVGANNFWTSKSYRGTSNYSYRRVLNETVVSIWQQIANLDLYYSGAVITNSTDCYSLPNCFIMTNTSVAQRWFDASNSDKVNVTFYSKLDDLGIGDKVSVYYYDGIQHLLKEWNYGDEHDWTFNSIEVGGLNFGSNKIEFRLNICPTSGNRNQKIMIDDIKIYQEKTTYYQDNAIIYVTARGGSELHISNITNIIVDVNYTYFDDKFSNITVGNISVIAEINQTYFNEQFNQTWFNQQTIYNFIQSMNTTIVNNQVYLKGKIDDIWNYVQEMINKIEGWVIS